MKHAMPVLLICSLLLTGCMAAAPQPTQAARTAEPPATTAATEPTVDSTLAMLSAYEKVLEKFYTDNIAPDGQELWFDSSVFGSIDENSFAVADVDGDGQEELVLLFGTAPMAGMCGWIYGYDSATDALYEKLSVFPNLTFYTGGYLCAGLSHNQGLAGSVLWPYTLMRYDPETRTYAVVAHVDAWDRSLHETDFEGNPYPEEADPDNTGAVYLITQQTAQGTWETDTVSRSVYDAWYAGLLSDAKPIEPEFLKTTLDNIHAVSPMD